MDPVRTRIYFDVRFIRDEDEHFSNEMEGYYFPKHENDLCFTFVREISLPYILPVGSTYQLQHDPTDGYQLTGAHDRVHNEFCVMESGIREEGDHAIPFFVLSDDHEFSEWLGKNVAVQANPEEEQIKLWESHVGEIMAAMTPRFEEHGWKFVPWKE